MRLSKNVDAKTCATAKIKLVCNLKKCLSTIREVCSVVVNFREIGRGGRLFGTLLKIKQHDIWKLILISP